MKSSEVCDILPRSADSNGEILDIEVKQLILNQSFLVPKHQALDFLKSHSGFYEDITIQKKKPVKQ